MSSLFQQENLFDYFKMSQWVQRQEREAGVDQQLKGSTGNCVDVKQTHAALISFSPGGDVNLLYLPVEFDPRRVF